MKKINILLTLGLFVLLVGVAQPAQAGVMGGNWIDPLMFPGNYLKEVAHLNAALGKFEGLLNAASAKADGFSGLEAQFSATASDLSSSLEQFNTALMEVYPTLSEEEQLAVREAYSSLESYSEDLVARTNSVFDREVLKIIIVQDEEESIDSVQTFGLVLGPGQ